MNAIPVVARRRGRAAAGPGDRAGPRAGELAWADRRVAALALGKLGKAADVPALVRAAGDASSFVREAAAIALGEIGDPHGRGRSRRSPGTTSPRSGTPPRRPSPALPALTRSPAESRRIAPDRAPSILSAPLL